ncbi:MAG TPA: HAD family hydrolase [Segetibacter sp.]|jgi:putative hydrolase of the HAD superfamily
MRRAYIFDLDNTLFHTPSIGAELFAPVYKLIHDSGEHEEDFDEIKEDFTRIPFQKIAKKYHFNESLATECTELLKQLEYNKPIEPFDDYNVIKSLPADRFIVTSGFTKMQQSKINSLGIKEDFKEVHIIDNTTTDKVKKDVFSEIIQKHNYKPDEVVVVGDDPESEIKGGNELGVVTILYDKNNVHSSSEATYTIENLSELLSLK